jgi:hypothetical protein
MAKVFGNFWKLRTPAWFLGKIDLIEADATKWVLDLGVEWFHANEE